MKLRVNWGRASAKQLRRVLVDSDGDNAHLLTCVDEVMEHWEVRRAFAKAPHTPAAGTSTVAMFNEKPQVDLPFAGDIIAAQELGAPSKYPPLAPVRTRNPR